MRNQKAFFLILGFFIFIQFSFSQANEQSELSRVDEFAQENLSNVLAKIPKSQLKEFGFNNADELKIAQIAKALYFSIFEDTRNIRVWRVPITVNGEYRALLNINENNGVYNIADFGANMLAKEMQQTIISHQDINFEGLLRSYQNGSDFMIGTNDNGLKVYIPLGSAIKSFAEKGITLKPIYLENELKTLLK
jgi:hypothetical protein